jgi:hypothetical protein
MEHEDINGRASPSLKEIAIDLAARPLNVLVLGDFGGEELDAPLAERLSAVVEDVDASLAAVSPVVRVRVEEVDSADDALIDVKLTFRKLADFSQTALEGAIPALARFTRTQAASAPGSSQTDLERTIAAALSGRSVPSASAAPDDGSSRQNRQLGLVRAVPRLVSLERAWLGLAHILESARAQSNHAVAVRILPIGARELLRELAHIEAGDDSALLDVLDRIASQPTTRPDLVVIDEPIGVDPAGASAMRGLARLSSECAAIVLAAVRDADLALDIGSTLEGASGVDRVMSGLNFAAFRSLRSDPRTAGLALTARSVQRARPSSAQDLWGQSPSLALGALLVGTSTGLSVGELCMVGECAADVRTRGTVSASASAAFAERGVTVPWNDAQSLRVGPHVPVLVAPPRFVGEQSETARATSLDVRMRLALSRLTRLASIAIRAVGAPGRDREACADFSTAIATALRPAADKIIGTTAQILLAASFDGPDERSLRVEIAVSAEHPAAGSRPASTQGGVPFEVRCGCYPLA